eukprot:5246539-Pyramimonas_sp.AAC.1
MIQTARAGYPSVLRVRWVLVRTLGRVPWDVLRGSAGGGFRVLEGCSSGLGAAVSSPNTTAMVRD